MARARPRVSYGVSLDGGSAYDRRVAENPDAYAPKLARMRCTRCRRPFVGLWVSTMCPPCRPGVHVQDGPPEPTREELLRELTELRRLLGK